MNKNARSVPEFPRTGPRWGAAGSGGLDPSRWLLLAALVSVTGCRRNLPPMSPAKPQGSDSLIAGVPGSFQTRAEDPNGDSVSIRFAWGDGDTSDWSASVASGQDVDNAHAFRRSYALGIPVSAQARDAHDAASEWSEAETVRIYWADNHPPSAPDRPDGWDQPDMTVKFRYWSAACDPDSDLVAIRFAWGDGDTSQWSRYAASGTQICDSHAFDRCTTFEVRAQAMDEAGALSAWSNPWAVNPGRVTGPGELRWRLYLGGGSTPAVGDDGTIYIADRPQGFCAVSPSGALKWQVPTSGLAPPVIGSDGTIYLVAGDLRAFKSDGSPCWSRTLPGIVMSCPALGADGSLYCGTDNDTLYCVAPDGSVRWAVKLGEEADVPPVIGPDSTIYVVTAAGQLCALDPSGSTRWQTAIGMGPNSPPAVDSGGRIYIANGPLYAIRCSDGRILWELDDVGSGLPVVVGTEGNIYVATMRDWFFWAVNRDATVHWRHYWEGEEGFGAPAVASNGTVYVGTAAFGRVHAYTHEGAGRWDYKGSSGIRSSLAIGPDGTVYYCALDGYLYAIEGTDGPASSPWPMYQHDRKRTGRFGGEW